MGVGPPGRIGVGRGVGFHIVGVGDIVGAKKGVGDPKDGVAGGEGRGACVSIGD